MLSSDGGENEVFYDSTDCLPSEEPVVDYEDCGPCMLDYGVWTREPQSVEQRRVSFLLRMGLEEFAPSRAFRPDAEMEIGVSSRMSEDGSVLNSSGANSGLLSSSDVEEVDSRNTSFSKSVADQDDQSVSEERNATQSSEECGKCEVKAGSGECQKLDECKQKPNSWWKLFMRNKSSQTTKGSSEKGHRIKVRQSKKNFKEFAALYTRQEIHAHKGLIWTMKFSSDGQYLATGGRDGVVRVWRVTVDAPSNCLASENKFCSEVTRDKSMFLMEPKKHADVYIPEKTFRIEECPLHEFHGHSSDVLDLAWSGSNNLLSCSADKTVRLWEVGAHECLNVFHHRSPVTCIQFNPANENQFLSGSVDGKIRIWGVSEKRVIDWADAREVITAVCYQPDGKGFIVGLISGTCRFYEASGEHWQASTQVNIQDRRKASGRKITSIQFSKGNSQRVLITSDDSKVYVFDGVGTIRRYKGLSKSGRQMSASFAPDGRHIVSVGEDSRVYIWNYDTLSSPSVKGRKSLRSCEYFVAKDASVAIPWPGMATAPRSLSKLKNRDCMEACSRIRDSERHFLHWFWSPCQSSSTWPEEKLIVQDLPITEDENENENENLVQAGQAWGLVIVTAGGDGIIRTFHNWGLPVRL